MTSRSISILESQDMETETAEQPTKMGLVTIGIDGFLPRIAAAASLLLYGEFEFVISAEDFIEEGERPVDTTCLLLASTEELAAQEKKRPKWRGGSWNEDETLWTPEASD